MDGWEDGWLDRWMLPRFSFSGKLERVGKARNNTHKTSVFTRFPRLVSFSVRPFPSPSSTLIRADCRSLAMLIRAVGECVCLCLSVSLLDKSGTAVINRARVEEK